MGEDAYASGIGFVKRKDRQVAKLGSQAEILPSPATNRITLDLTFGTDGKVFTDFFGSMDLGYSLKVQSDDKIVLPAPQTAGSLGTSDWLATTRVAP
jgi:hypothetical protein